MLRTLDAGSWFDPAFAGERIPLLVEVLGSLPPRIGLNVEAKTDGDRKRNGMLACTIASLLRRAPGAREFLVSSFDRGFLSMLRQVAPEIPRGVLYVPLRDRGRSVAVLARSVAAAAFVCSRTQLRARMVVELQRAGIRCMVYGVNTPEHLHRCARFGVDGVITDVPGRLRSLLTLA
jgi:glycerophosphoryl diester phosphodiesterase